MKFFANIQLSKVKCLDFHPIKPIVFLGLYNGTVLIYDTNTLTLIHCLNIGHVVRTICATENLLITGDDSGTITIFDSNFYKIKSSKVHSDFIRKIIFYDQLIYSCGDDTLIIASDLDLNRSFYLEGHKHFIMDLLISNDQLFSVSLDNKLGIYNLKNKNKSYILCHTGGINTLCMFNKYLVTGSDDPSIKLWSNNKLISQVEFTNNVSKVFSTKDILCVCTENGDFSIFNEELQVLEKINLNVKLWDVKVFQSQIWICTDEGIRIFELKKFQLGFVNNDKMYYLEGDVVYYARVVSSSNDNLMIKKSKLPFEPEKAIISPNGKIIAIHKKSNFSILNTLGFRLKVSGKCKDIGVGNNWYVIYDDVIQVYDYNRLVGTIDEKPLRIEVKNEYLVCYFTNETLIYKDELEMELKMAKSVDFIDLYIPYTDPDNNPNTNLDSDPDTNPNTTISIESKQNNIKAICDNEVSDDNCNINDNKEKVINTVKAVVIQTDQLEIKLPKTSYFIDKSIDSYFIYKNILFYLYNKMLYYVIIYKDKIHSIFICNVENTILGINDFGLVTWDNSFKVIDIKIQQIIECTKILNKIIKPNKNNTLLTQFFISINEYTQALNYCSDNFIKFDILLSLNKLNQCKKIACNKTMHKKLAEKFLVVKDYKNACEHFYLAKEFDNAYLVDDGVYKYEKLESDLEIVRVYEYNEMVEFFRGSVYEQLVNKFYKD